MKHSYLLLSLLCCFSAFGQAPEALLKIIGPEVVALPVKPRHVPLDASDTILTANNEYHYAHWQMDEIRSPDAYCFLHLPYVTVGEYTAFQDDVRDSMARDLIYFGLEEDEKQSGSLLRVRKMRFTTFHSGKRTASVFPLTVNRTFPLKTRSTGRCCTIFTRRSATAISAYNALHRERFITVTVLATA